MRVFAALDPSEEVRDRLVQLQDKLTVGRHVPADDLHLTLVFVEDAPLPALEELNLDLETLTPPLPALSLKGVDVFGNDPPRSLHVAVENDAALIALQKKVEGFARRAGLRLPHRRFVPHITIARFPHTMEPADMAKIGRFLQAHGDWTL